MPTSAHIAGIGSASISRNETLEDLAIAAGTKALLDAGLTYSSVDNSIACFLHDRDRIRRSSFAAFGKEGAPASEIDNTTGLFTAVQYVRSGQSNCVLVVGLDTQVSSTGGAAQPLVVAIVLVSKLFLTSHAYLKDSSIHIRACSLTSRFHSRTANSANQARTAKTAVQTALRQAQVRPQDLQIIEVKRGSYQQHLREALEGAAATQSQTPQSSSCTTSVTGWSGICGLVYQLRGWLTDAPAQRAENCLQYTADDDGTASAIILSRSNGQPAPAWQDIKNVRDGRERLGYNPAMEVRVIAQEDLQAVRAKQEFTSDADLMRLRLPVKGGDRAALARL